MTDNKEFVINFFNVKEGMRARVRIDSGKNHPQMCNDAVYMPYLNYPLIDINDINYDREFSKVGTQHFLSLIFDDGVKFCKSKEEVGDHAIGFTPVMDIDSPHQNSGTKTRYNSLGHYQKSIMEKFDKIRLLAKEELIDSNMWENTRLLWSGNGYYIILPDMYGTIDEIEEEMTGFVGLEMWINDQLGGGKCSRLVDERAFAWNRFFKIPYTRHMNYVDRISLPLNREASFVNGIVEDRRDWK